MSRFFQRQGSTTVEILSEDRTASPNIWWPAEQMRDHGFSECEPDAAASKAAAVASFVSKTFFGRLIQEFSQERWFALSKLGVGWTMQQLIDFPNFEGLKAYAGGLIADETITLEDAGKINACLLEQGINLEDF
jgi:hypothetical protein